MLTQLRSLWSRLRQSGKLGDFDALKSDVMQVLALDLTSGESREEHGEFVLKTLQQLNTEIEKIRSRANGYPANPINGLVWWNGLGYGNLASALTYHFQSAGWLEHEENASAMWARVTLAVTSHYHYMVGPAMLANADCHDRLGNVDMATGMYRAVVMDFAFLVDGWRNNSEPLVHEEDQLEIESLATALQQLIGRGVHHVDDINLDSLYDEVQEILGRVSPEESTNS